MYICIGKEVEKKSPKRQGKECKNEKQNNI